VGEETEVSLAHRAVAAPGVLALAAAPAVVLLLPAGRSGEIGPTRAVLRLVGEVREPRHAVTTDQLVAAGALVHPGVSPLMKQKARGTSPRNRSEQKPSSGAETLLGR
jgi:hypothetical protein